jgi:hypothetical protein
VEERDMWGDASCNCTYDGEAIGFSLEWTFATCKDQWLNDFGAQYGCSSSGCECTRKMGPLGDGWGCSREEIDHLHWSDEVFGEEQARLACITECCPGGGAGGGGAGPGDCWRCGEAFIFVGQGPETEMVWWGLPAGHPAHQMGMDATSGFPIVSAPNEQWPMGMNYQNAGMELYSSMAQCQNAMSVASPSAPECGPLY